MTVLVSGQGGGNLDSSGTERDRLLVSSRLVHAVSVGGIGLIIDKRGIHLVEVGVRYPIFGHLLVKAALVTFVFQLGVVVGLVDINGACTDTVIGVSLTADLLQRHLLSLGRLYSLGVSMQVLVQLGGRESVGGPFRYQDAFLLLRVYDSVSGSNIIATDNDLLGNLEMVIRVVLDIMDLVQSVHSWSLVPIHRLLLQLLF